MSYFHLLNHTQNAYLFNQNDPSSFIIPRYYEEVTHEVKDQTNIRRAQERGHANHGWLDSWHTFSFADYYDRRHMGFRSLRVINQDRIAPGRGFPTHPHRDMEIFSYLLEGELEHHDSMGNRRVLSPGQIQLMSAGSGVTHSEFNPNQDREAHLLQIWIRPRELNLSPTYTEWHPNPDQDSNPKVLVISPDGRDRSATIHQDAHVDRLRIKAGESITHELLEGRGFWLQVIKGTIETAGEVLEPGDALSSENPNLWSFKAQQDSEVLLFDLGPIS